MQATPRAAGPSAACSGDALLVHASTLLLGKDVAQDDRVLDRLICAQREALRRLGVAALTVPGGDTPVERRPLLERPQRGPQRALHPLRLLGDERLEPILVAGATAETD